ncbi:sialate O-acetylesterase [Aurantimonas sp. A2-1-M11]|uniref:sialate O-acetylesterase n=1 Tax=Aurantimonas sp. A2-1-M11 TaxID=3113712 RepID=UPI002F937DF0
MAYTSVRGPDIALPARGPIGDVTPAAALLLQQSLQAVVDIGASAVQAEEAEAGAVTARIGAEAARDAATINANVYTDIATGRAAVADGVQFMVVSGNEIIRYRRDSVSTQTEMARYPTSDALSELDVVTGRVDTLERVFPAESDARGVLVAFVDGYGYATLRIDTGGTLVSAAGEIGGGAGVGSTGNWLYERDVIVVDGQSLATGAGAVALSVSQAYNTRMLSGGVRTRATTPYTGQTLAPLVEALVSGEGETPVSGMTDAINELVLSENGLNSDSSGFQMVGMAPGQGSTPIGSHRLGSTIFTNAMAAIDRIVALGAIDGKPTSLRSLGWVQGESDYLNLSTRTSYAAAMADLLAEWDAAVKTRTGQAQDVQMLSYQTSGHSAYGVATPYIALAQLDAAITNDDIHLVTPIYQMDTSDNVHLDAPSYRWLGAYLGLAYKRVIIDGLSWRCLRPLTKVSQGTSCIVEFDVPAAPLVLDTTWVTNPGNFGFQLVDSGGSPLTISSVSLLGPTRVKIIASSTLPVGFKVRYAWGPGGTYAAGRTTGPRGNLRDSAGDRVVFDPSGINRPMHNWCAIFEI